LELEQNEINALLFYAKTINQYKEYPIFNEITNAIQKVIENSNISPETQELFKKHTLLETENHPSIGGIEMIAEILDAITKRKILSIDYQKFDDKIKTHLIKPLLLKEDKKLWYVIGVSLKKNTLITLALDRVIDVTTCKEEFKEIIFDSSEYFKYSFGVTVSEREPIEVVISFKPEQGNYLKNLPIHQTQQIIEDNDEKFVIKVKVKPSYEFYSKVFSYGSGATVISPKTVVEEVSKDFEKALSQYNSK